MTASLRRFLCILALVGIAACSGGNTSPHLPPSSVAQQAAAVNALRTAPSTPICVDPLIAAGPKIFDPAPGATNVSTAPGNLIVANSLDRYRVPFVGILTPTSGGASISTSPLRPHGKRRAAAAYPQLAAGTTYEIRFESTRGTPCFISTPSVKGFTTTGTVVSPPPSSTPTFCPVIDPVFQTLVQPAAGATNVAPNIGIILVRGPIASLTLQPPTGPPIVTSTIVPLPLSAGPPNPGGPLIGFAIPLLAAGTTYTVTAHDDVVITGCPSPSVGLGSFTTAGTVVTPPPTSTPTFCPVYDPVPEGLLSPANGATNISPAIGVIVVYGTPIVSLTLTPPSGAAIETSTIVPPPSGITATPYGPPIGFHIPALAPGTTYQITAHYLPNPQFANCPSPAFGLGSFTTSR
jgi:hypothetical protein